MRCPKCGYISFDHMESCLKCNKDISKTSSHIEGTTYNVAPPAFLKFNASKESSKVEDEEFSLDMDDQDDYEVVDPDLDILVEEDVAADSSDEIDFDSDFGGLDGLADEDDFEISAPAVDHHGDDSLDLDQFEDAFDEEKPAFADDEIQLDLPDELADISDLSPPAEDDAIAAFDDAPAGMSAEDDEEDSLEGFGLNLDLDDLEDDFSLDSDEGDKGEEVGDPLGDLSLDDIGLSLDDKPSGTAKRSGDETDMDADLDFNLDLGDLSLGDDK